MKAIVVIPSRLASTRLPRKPLLQIAGKPMIQRVYEGARASSSVADVIVATDSDEIFDLCASRGMKVEMTSSECRSGTDRVREVASRVSADVYVNLQGDEPMARPEQIDTLLALMLRPGVEVGTLMTPCKPEEVNSPSAVKVVARQDGRALYFSRATIPHDRDDAGSVARFKHLGFYAYTGSALERFCAWPESALERAERLEQLRFLDNGVDLWVAETPFDSIGVDTAEDLARVDAILRAEGRV